MFEIEHFDLKGYKCFIICDVPKRFQICAMFNNDIKNVIMLRLSFIPFRKLI